MKLTGHFNRFLSEKVNLSRTRLETLGSSVEAVYGALKADDELGDLILARIPQGSWAHRTIIMPPAGKEFDADFLVEFDEVTDWSHHPSTYIEKLNEALARHGTYKSMPREQKNRCVRLRYKGDFHLDIVPYLRFQDGRQVIVNADEDDWEPTNPEGFTAWMKEKDETAGGNLRKIIRIMKYLRDYRGGFTGTRSIILTTLLGERVEASNLAAAPDYYADVPTCLVHISEDLNEWLQQHESRPSIQDPSDSGADFDHRWSDSAYETLRERVYDFAQDSRAALDEKDSEQSQEMWRAIFGDGFSSPPRGGGGGPFGVIPPARPRAG